ncbi:unnamed protein product [Phytophthora lilii]|uniref:Unnamed protein product n=1 Tax=Phytophthora lilii TaxID=2077276 RepID=A0A9W6X539_9STRA|nr:unnamed protein product [Phytophthora lilii]
MPLMPHHRDVLFLIAQYLQARGLFASSLALQQESGLDVTWLRGPSRELALLRRWIFNGDVKRARAMLHPLQNLDEFSEELQAAQLALNELEGLMMKPLEKATRSQIAEAKLLCFSKMVPLFRVDVDPDEVDVFKYVAMPRLQLARLIGDAMLFHQQCGDTVQDCISETCGESEETTKDDEYGELLLLDKSLEDVSVKALDLHSEKDEEVAHSVDWTSSKIRRQPFVACSINLSALKLQETSIEDEVVEMVETKECAVQVHIEIEESLTVKEDGKHPDVKETADVAVSCGPDVATQTEHFSLHCVNERYEESVLMEENELGEENQKDELEDVSSTALNFTEKTELDDNQQLEYEEQNFRDQADTRGSCVSSSSRFDASWAHKSFRSVTMDTLDIPDAFLPEQGKEPIELVTTSKKDGLGEPRHEVDDELEFENQVSAQVKTTPLSYDELTLEHVVCASVIAEVKEPQAVRALDVHPSGTQLAVGTNARALRIFDLLTPLRQRQHQFSGTSAFNLLLPLLPVVHERHKHHDSGIYCVSYNRYLLRSVRTASTMVASGAADGSVKVLVTREADPLQRHQLDELWIQRGDIGGSMGKTRALEFSSPHHLWVASTSDRRLRCWDVRRSQRSSSSGAFQTLDGHVGEIQTIAIPQSSIPGLASTLLMSAALDKTVRLWDTRSRRCERLVTSGAHAAFSLHFHPTDERLVVSGHQDGSVALWDLRSTAREALQTVAPHQDECRSVRWSPQGQWLLSAAFDGTLCVMQASSRATLLPVASYHKHYGKVLQAQWHPTEPAFVSSGADKRVKLWAFA